MDNQQQIRAWFKFGAMLCYYQSLAIAIALAIFWIITQTNSLHFLNPANTALVICALLWLTSGALTLISFPLSFSLEIIEPGDSSRETLWETGFKSARVRMRDPWYSRLGNILLFCALFIPLSGLLLSLTIMAITGSILGYPYATLGVRFLYRPRDKFDREYLELLVLSVDRDLWVRKEATKGLAEIDALRHDIKEIDRQLKDRSERQSADTRLENTTRIRREIAAARTAHHEVRSNDNG